MLWWRLRQLRSKDARTRGNAARRLGESKDPRAVEPLVAALKDEKWEVRAGAAYGLGKIADAQAVEPLVAALVDKNSMVRADTARALGKIADARAVEPLVAALKDEYSYVRGAAATALGEIGDTRAVESLVAAFADRDRDGYVPLAAKQALELLGWRAPVVAEPAAPLGALPSSMIVFRSGADQPQSPLAYTQQIVSWKYQRDASNVELEAWRIVGVRDEFDADSARILYLQLKDTGQLPDFGPLSDTFEGKGPDGRSVVAFFFGGAAAKEAPPARLALDVNNPACTLCGKDLGGGKPIFAGAQITSSRPAGEVLDDYTLLRGSICFNCRVVLCTDCLGERVDQCPKCKGGTKPAYRRHLRELAAL